MQTTVDITKNYKAQFYYRCKEWKPSNIELLKTFRRVSNELRGCNRRIAGHTDASHSSPVSWILRNRSPKAAKAAAAISASK